ncbi:MAG: hypothetical protein E7677_05640 [Ruminococcaceae bacterium]|nr:hypothetical protein [Oscillospiraceae bacterium]
MNFSSEVLRSDERAIYALRELYSKFGYSRYKVGRFEEYDLYARNKSFLVSENILTFTDTNGKLMALKPDVTLSIIKNISDGKNETHKLYYNENVYRTSAESHGFKEIVQTGLECVGNIDTYAQSEVVMLALKSLEGISEEYVLDISHMGLVEGLIDAAGLEDAARDEAMDYIKSKNVSALKNLCTLRSVSEDVSEVACALTEIYSTLDDALSVIEKNLKNEKMAYAYGELVSINEAMKSYGVSGKLYFDFSVVNDRNYYDGVIFKGFINGIPTGVLSGGRYDKLLSRMGKQCGAIGFAVYLDTLERFGNEDNGYDTDILLVYENVSTDKIIATVKELVDSGKTVKVASAPDASVRYRQLLKISERGVESLETND